MSQPHSHTHELELPEAPQRTFLDPDFKAETWDEIEPYYLSLLAAATDSPDSLRTWFAMRDELEAALEEAFAWRYIEMSRDTNSEEKLERYQFFVQEIQPKIQPLADKLNRKALESPYLDKIKEEGFDQVVRSLRTAVEIYREENIDLFAQMQTRSQQYAAITGAMSIEVDGVEKTLQQAGLYLKSPDRAVRESVWKKINERRLQDREKLDALFDDLISLRHQVALNAGFDNYRDYQFVAMGRFDYGVQDCLDFHESVRTLVVPILGELAKQRKEELGVESLKVWDLSVDPKGRGPIRPFETSEELLSRSIEALDRLSPWLGDRLRIMERMGHLDLESRKGKAPGGYNYPLDEVGVPFIFMNAAHQLRDVVTLLHEAGHAVHSFKMRDLSDSFFKHPPSEVAELASMSMELLTLPQWDVYFDDPQELHRAQREHIESLLDTLPWVALIDKFQHWIYTNPTHTAEERAYKWVELHKEFGPGEVEWAGQEEARHYLWQKQLHLYEVPFYYIEYGFAQLGAIAVWKRASEDAKGTLDDYLAALSMGYMQPIPAIYERAGISFDFSPKNIGELAAFVKAELDKLPN